MKKTNRNKSRSDDARMLTEFVNVRDEEAFARLVNKYERLVWNVCCRILDNRVDVEDAFQNTFVLLATKAHRIRKPESLASWLYGTAFRTASTIRRQRHRANEPFVDSPDRKTNGEIWQKVARKNEGESVHAELMLLSEKYRAPLLRFYFVGENASQIAETLGLSVAAVESRLRRGRNVLKTRLLRLGISSATCVACLTSCSSATGQTSIVAQAVSKGLAASVGNPWAFPRGIEYLNQTGAKLMIIKSTLAFGVTCLMGLGIAMHAVPTKTQIALDVAEVDTSTIAESVRFTQEEDDDDSHSIHSFFQHLHSIFYHLHFGELEEDLTIEAETDDDVRRYRLELHEIEENGLEEVEDEVELEVGEEIERHEVIELQLLHEHLHRHLDREHDDSSSD